MECLALEPISLTCITLKKRFGIPRFGIAKYANAVVIQFLLIMSHSYCTGRHKKRKTRIKAKYILYIHKYIHIHKYQQKCVIHLMIKK